MSAKPYSFRDFLEVFREGFTRADFKLIDGTPYLRDDLSRCDQCREPVHSEDLERHGAYWICPDCRENNVGMSPSHVRVSR